MPGYILHLLHGKFYLEQYCADFSEIEKKQFTMGILMPDSNKELKIGNDNSHYYDEEQNDQILQYPDLKRFPYYNLIDTPYVLGYLAHLYLDRCFFSDYFQRYVQFLDANNRKTLKETEIERVLIVKSKQYISVAELFSEQFLYGDYTMLNKFIVDKYKISQVDSVPVLNPIQEVNLDNFEAVRRSLKRYLAESTGQIDTHVFPIDTLEAEIERYAYGFGQWVDGVMTVLH